MVPIMEANFLVGENSTGKSSFLHLLNLISSPKFYLSLQFNNQIDINFGGYQDLVSAGSADKSYFKVGIVNINIKEKFNIDFNVYEFSNYNNDPIITKYIQKNNTEIISIVKERKYAKYDISNTELLFNSEDDAVIFFHKNVESIRANTPFPKSMPMPIPLTAMISIAKKISSEVDFFKEIRTKLHSLDSFVDIAPIRTKPNQIYYGVSNTYSPDGSHAPFILRNILNVRGRKSKNYLIFIDKLKQFGDSSGLFSLINTHSFGNEPQAPFEILIKISDENININNVGYGVSQVLPLIIEFLSRINTVFSVQQPEVHLHPKAQAALGELIYATIMEKKHKFFIETHSDYLIDRYRLSLKNDNSVTSPSSQVLFFSRKGNENTVFPIKIQKNGKYSPDQPNEFRDFFINEEMKLLEI